MRILIALSLLITLISCQYYIYDSSIDNDQFKSVKQITEENGFIYEEYNVTTEDHYILTLMRIPGHVGEDPSVKKPVVLMEHGLEADASNWIINSDDRAPAFILVR